MRIGLLFIGWQPISESERIALGVDPLFGGWDALCIQWRNAGYMIALRPRRKRNREVSDG